MTTKSIRIGATAGVIVLALMGLMCTTLSEGTEHYKHVDEVMGDPQAWHGKRLQLHGFVMDPVYHKADTLEYRFQVQSNGKVVPATYKGVVPDTSSRARRSCRRAGSVRKGSASPSNGVMAKCPSEAREASRAPAAPGT